MLSINTLIFSSIGEHRAVLIRHVNTREESCPDSGGRSLNFRGTPSVEYRSGYFWMGVVRVGSSETQDTCIPNPTNVEIKYLRPLTWWHRSTNFTTVLTLAPLVWSLFQQCVPVLLYTRTDLSRRHQPGPHWQLSGSCLLDSIKYKPRTLSSNLLK